MALDFFNLSQSFEKIAAEEKRLPSGMVWTAGIARAAHVFGLSVKFFSTNFTQPSSDLDFYKKYATDQSMLVLAELMRDLAIWNIPLVQRELALDELLSHIATDELPIVLLNWNRVHQKPGFQGHFVPVVGFDKDTVLVHHPGLATPTPFMQIPRAVFDQARRDSGTDMDTVLLKKI